ncbi:hypothetical protein EK21DRAFT_90449 [Setomelanomma holmii]|uniref:Uncharacterized protein n=1 Tax=Setomelanomma holmii TaxID=210430 RepID=A0A9P4H7I0_9PLEO|nr:hypothetical protein EK21DRAFT_90449 [Setomelanomma holmii]
MARMISKPLRVIRRQASFQHLQAILPWSGDYAALQPAALTLGPHPQPIVHSISGISNLVAPAKCAFACQSAREPCSKTCCSTDEEMRYGEVEENELNRNTSFENGIARRTTAEALDLITRPETQTLSHSAWYEPGRDFCFYAAAHDACRATKTRLKALDLKVDEFESINSARGLDVLLQKIQQTTEAQEQASKRHPVMKKAGHFVEIFSEFVTRTSGIIELLVPQSPEYRMTYGVLLLVFKTVFKRKETQESLLAYIQKLSIQLPIVDFYGKRIEAKVEKLHELTEAAHVAQQADIKELLESTGQVVGRLYEDLTQSMTAFGSCLTLFDARIEKIAQQSSSIHNFQAVNHSLALAEVLLPTASTAGEQISLVRKRHFDLSPKDHWYENGVLEAFNNWSAYGRIELLWIGDRSGNQGTWVTEMSIDLIDALRMQDLTLLHVFCDMTDKPITATTLMKRLIAQLLDCHPDIPFRQPRTYNVRRFRDANTFTRLWTIFEALVSELTSSVFVLIDRIERIDANPDSDRGGRANLSHQLLPYLMGLASEAEHVSVIVTSTYEPPKGLIGEVELRYFYRDTRKSRGKRER